MQSAVKSISQEKSMEDIAQSNLKTSQVIVFKLGNEEYGLMIDQIKEVVITPNITKVPLAPRYIKGVANIRGNILSIIDPEERLGLALEKDTANTSIQNYTLVVESNEVKMGILVREVPNTLAISEKDIDNTPNIIQGTSIDSGYILGIVKKQNRLIILIDIYRLIKKEEVSTLM
ncbi:MAG: chemotaxis protein CheW [Cytophagales bacterium]|nr:chemotaxis protein CheW [Cytophagales bacterium]